MYGMAVFQNGSFQPEDPWKSSRNFQQPFGEKTSPSPCFGKCGCSTTDSKPLKKRRLCSKNTAFEAERVFLPGLQTHQRLILSQPVFNPFSKQPVLISTPGWFVKQNVSCGTSVLICVNTLISIVIFTVKTS